MACYNDFSLFLTILIQLIKKIVTSGVIFVKYFSKYLNFTKKKLVHVRSQIHLRKSQSYTKYIISITLRFAQALQESWLRHCSDVCYFLETETMGLFRSQRMPSCRKSAAY